MNRRWIWVLIFAVSLVAADVQSALMPLTVDAATLHLWHFDETAPPCEDAVPGGANLNYMIGGATLGNASYSGSPAPVGFTNCISFGTLETAGAVIFPDGSGNTGDPASFTYAGNDGAFTFEAMVKVLWDPTNNYSVNPPRNQPFQIMDCDADSAGSRVFQFRIDPVGFTVGGATLTRCGIEFINGTTTIAVAPIPTNGPDAIASNAWYHVAVTYDGNPGAASNLLFYWTLLDPNRTNADCIYATNMAANLDPASSATTVFSIGNSARNPDGGSGPDTANFVGAIDEVRISSIARPADAMVFVSTNTASASGPVLSSDTSIVPSSAETGQPVLLSAFFTGSEPISYQWYFNHAPIPGATSNTYSIAAVQLTNAGSYSLTAWNDPPGLGWQTNTSTPATLTVSSFSSGGAQTNPVSEMFCELLDHPELTVVTAQDPAFGWDYRPCFRDDFQTSFRLIVSSSQALSAAGTGDLWDSGWVQSSNSINVPYAGSTLQPNSSYYWRVQTMDSASQTGSLSAIQQFNTASELSNPLTQSGVIYQQPGAGSANCYPLNYIPALPVLVTNTAPGTWFVDFGQDAFGYATVHANGAFSGANVHAGFGEWTNGDGDVVDESPPGTVRYGASTFALQNGDAIYSVYPPSFNGNPDTQIVNPPSSFGRVMPFRYLELTNFPGTLTATDVVQERLATAFDTNASSFNSSSPALNEVWSLCRNSMQWLTFDGIYVDGDRERTPYEADAFMHQLSSYAVNDDFTMPRCTFEYLTTHPTWPTEWKFHMIMMAWADYLQTGNSTLLSKYYSALQQDCFTWAATGNGLMRGFPNFPQTTNSDIVDWPAADRDGFIISSGSYLNWTNSVNNAFYYHCLRLMANIAAVTGHTNDSTTYTADANQVYNAYNSTFWNAAAQCYVDGVGTTHGSAHANFFPLVFGLVPASNQVAVVNYLHSRIAADGGMPPSVYGAQYLLEALFQAGDADTALGLMITNGPRSWMEMINLGSTLTDEAWNLADKSNEDWNHAWGAAPGNLIARYVLGLQPLAPGYGRILIQPELGQTLSFAQGTVPTIRGPVSISANNAPGQFQLWVNIPGNVITDVKLPAFDMTNAVALVDGEVVAGSLSNNWLTVCGIGSGQHAIWLSTNGSPSSAMLYDNWASSWFGTNAAIAAIAGPTANPDGNGYDNYYDFVTGTDPTNPKAHFVLKVSTNSPNNFLIAVSGLAGRSYILQRTMTLSPADWSGIATNSPLSSNQTVFFNTPQPPSGSAFYKVLVTLP